MSLKVFGMFCGVLLHLCDRRAVFAGSELNVNQVLHEKKSGCDLLSISPTSDV